MGKTEMSSVLKNLKFMQRAAQKEEKPKKEEEEPKPNGNFVPPSNVNRKCMVIMEGDPQPGTVRGRMSFQQFNPLIDKLREEDAANGHEASTSSAFQSGRSNEREKRPSNLEIDDNNLNGELKRKQPKALSQKSHPKKLQKNGQAGTFDWCCGASKEGAKALLYKKIVGACTGGFMNYIRRTRINVKWRYLFQGDHAL
ncbi:uncharacterized protein LOC141622937 [Silene latifolia]|uniref:uncharacterized protein LOC141622937 n=1 Tax=Silene latifolia TaxID=37657 RepID=UPI003D771B7D